MVIRQNVLGKFPKASQVISPEDIIKARGVVRDVYMDEKIENYILDIVFATRYPRTIWPG